VKVDAEPSARAVVGRPEESPGRRGDEALLDARRCGRRECQAVIVGAGGGGHDQPPLRGEPCALPMTLAFVGARLREAEGGQAVEYRIAAASAPELLQPDCCVAIL